jgi:hypothetical protein
MEFISFDKTKRNPVLKEIAPSISFDGRGKFNFSQGARRLFSFKEGDRVVLHQDKVLRNDWYLEFTTESKGYKIVINKTDSRFTCKRAAVELFKSLGKTPVRIAFLISEKPFISEGKFYYRIDTKNPITNNQYSNINNQ